MSAEPKADTQEGSGEVASGPSLTRETRAEPDRDGGLAPDEAAAEIGGEQRLIAD